MSDWDSMQYLKFDDERTRPAMDLAVRIHDMDPRTVVDIGCGPGNSTAVLKALFPDADILGIDSSPNMIDRARESYPDIRFEICDVRSLTGRYDLLFSNACLQWVPDHETLIPSLMERLNEGGVLAVQVPMNGDESLYRLIEEVSNESRWDFTEVSNQTNGTLTPAEYYNILSRCSDSFDIWETRYTHPLLDHRALVEFVKGSRLRPYLESLDEGDRREFEETIVERSKGLYPIMVDGTVLLGFRRFFFTAMR